MNPVYPFKVHLFDWRYVSKGGAQSCSMWFRTCLLLQVQRCDILGGPGRAIDGSGRYFSPSSSCPRGLTTPRTLTPAKSGQVLCWASQKVSCSNSRVDAAFQRSCTPSWAAGCNNSTDNRFIWRVAVSQLPGLHESMKCYWPNNSTMAWRAVSWRPRMCPRSDRG